MTADRIAALRQRIAEDRGTAEADERHWSEIPDALFTARRAIAEADAKTATLDMIERWTHSTQELRLVTGELLDMMETVHRSTAPIEFITTEASERYHTSADCSKFQAGRNAGDGRHPVVLLTASEAEQARQTACPECVPTA
jgi:hypothetical protein